MIKRVIDLSIVIPAFEEEKRIGLTLDEIDRFINHDNLLKTLSVEVIVVCAEAKDKTEQIIKDKQNTIKNLHLIKAGKKVGKGRDVKLGMLASAGRKVIFMDADLATPLSYLTIFIKEAEDYDIVIGVRDLYRHHSSYIRRFIAIIGNFLFKLAVGLNIQDTQCGFKLFSRQAADVCFNKMKINGWCFDMEILAISKANKFKIHQVKIPDWNSVPGGSLQNKIIQSLFGCFIDLCKIVFYRSTGQYKKDLT